MKLPDNLNELRSWDRNPREITTKAKEGLKVSIDTFGDLSGIVYNVRLQALVCGHQRVQAIREKYGSAAKLHIDQRPGDRAEIRLPNGETFPVRLVDWDETTHAAANITANNPHIAGDYTSETAAILAHVADTLPDLYAMLELDPLAADLGQGKTSGDRAGDFADPPAGDPVTKLGDVYDLGDHRLICGDSTDPAVLDSLMQGLKARVVNTDPPYGVSYKADGFDVIKNDDKRDEGLIALLDGSLRLAVRHTQEDAAFYVWHASATRREFEWAMDAVGLEEKQYIIWIKDSFVMGRADYQWGHEPCFYAQKRGCRAFWNGERDQPTVWRIQRYLDRDTLAVDLTKKGILLSNMRGRQIFLTDRAPKNHKATVLRIRDDGHLVIAADRNRTDAWRISHNRANYQHPTQKPPALATTAIGNSSKPGDLILDSFAGSGFTLLGAHRTGRKARLVELDPQYCDVIVDRWCHETGWTEIVRNGQPTTWRTPE